MFELLQSMSLSDKHAKHTAFIKKIMFHHIGNETSTFESTQMWWEKYIANHRRKYPKITHVGYPSHASVPLWPWAETPSGLTALLSLRPGPAQRCGLSCTAAMQKGTLYAPTGGPSYMKSMEAGRGEKQKNMKSMNISDSGRWLELMVWMFWGSWNKLS